MTWIVWHPTSTLAPDLMNVFQKSLDVTIGHPEVRTDVYALNVVSEI